MEVSNELKQYIENNIYPLYQNNYIGDGVDRIDYVINRSKKIISENNLQIDDDILYTAIAYHDIRTNNKEQEHELASAKKFYFGDTSLKKITFWGHAQKCKMEVNNENC